MYRLLLEYGRIIDDSRDRIGYSGDGTEVDKAFNPPAPPARTSSISRVNSSTP
jgi:hypothetical protein